MISYFCYFLEAYHQPGAMFLRIISNYEKTINKLGILEISTYGILFKLTIGVVTTRAEASEWPNYSA